MTVENGGGSRSNERLAPVIPLFGGGSGTGVPSTAPTQPLSYVVTPQGGIESLTTAAELRRSSASGDTGIRASIDSGTPSERHPARGGTSSQKTPPRLRALRGHTDQPEGEDAPDPQRMQEAASESLVRKLRARSLSVSEARMVLRGHQLASEQIEDVIDDFLRRGYLDDAMLAEQLVDSGAQRKGQGRVALSRALAQRGIPRDVIDAALGELPNDDAERALEFARSKARSLSRLDPDTALRRLMGQLARRGYGGSVAMTAAKTALAEETFGGSSSGVRFVDSD